MKCQQKAQKNVLELNSLDGPLAKRSRMSNEKDAPPINMAFDKITKNPGLQHVSEDIFKLLDKKSLMNCRLVNHSWKDILDQPNFWFKKLKEDEKDLLKNSEEEDDDEEDEKEDEADDVALLRNSRFELHKNA